MGTDTSRKDHRQAANPGTPSALARLARLLARQSAGDCVDQSRQLIPREQTDDKTDRQAPAPSYRR